MPDDESYFAENVNKVIDERLAAPNADPWSGVEIEDRVRAIANEAFDNRMAAFEDYVRRVALESADELLASDLEAYAADLARDPKSDDFVGFMINRINARKADEQS